MRPKNISKCDYSHFLNVETRIKVVIKANKGFLVSYPVLPLVPINYSMVQSVAVNCHVDDI